MAGHVSVFEIFRLGIGPSSSHTVGPMRAAGQFMGELRVWGHLPRVTGLQAELFGSLGATGRGHGTDKAILLGLEGEEPETVVSERVDTVFERVDAAGCVSLPVGPDVPFDRERDIIFRPEKRLDFHPNALRLTATLSGGERVQRDYFSIGGGFVLNESEAAVGRPLQDERRYPLPFATAAELLVHCARERLTIAGVIRANETVGRSEAAITAGLLAIAEAMTESINAGCHASGILPGGLGVPRRAPAWFAQLSAEEPQDDPLGALDWVSLFALAVNEENAAGHRVVTAPTNGAAGVLPAVLAYYRRFVPGADDDGVANFLLAAGGIGGLIKRNASIAGAEVGCQGEVGTACAMAAAGLTQVLGGSPLQVENAAEIAMEHNLGLTCDPVGGLVQIPCIERNAIAAVKAINAARMALRGDGRHTVSLDSVIATMRQTGADMSSKYKETAQGGLAVNIIEC